MSDWKSMTTTSDTMPCIKCPCGFEVSGFDEAENNWAFRQHECSLVEHEPSRWYHYAFSFWGWAIFTSVAFLTGLAVTR